MTEYEVFMRQTITAIYEDGVLKPLHPLELQERQQVRLEVVSEEPGESVEAALRLLEKAGQLTRPSGATDLDPVTEEELRTLAERLGQAPGKPLSEIIIEDRGEF